MARVTMKDLIAQNARDADLIGCLSAELDQIKSAHQIAKNKLWDAEDQNKALREKLDEAFMPGPDDLFENSRESVRSCANAWLKVCEHLKRADPDFYKRGRTSSQCAIASIDAMARQCELNKQTGGGA